MASFQEKEFWVQFLGCMFVTEKKLGKRSFFIWFSHLKLLIRVDGYEKIFVKSEEEIKVLRFFYRVIFQKKD